MEVFNVMMAVFLTIIAIAILITLLFLSESGKNGLEDETPQKRIQKHPKMDNDSFISINDYNLDKIHKESENKNNIPDKITDFSEFLNTGNNNIKDSSETEEKPEDIKNLYNDDPINNEDLEWMKTK